MTEQHTILVFIKFGSKEHMEDLIENGTLYLNTRKYFTSIEDNNLRGDNYEGITYLKNYPKGQFEIPSLKYKGNYESLRIWHRLENPLGNIYSLFAVSSYGCPSPAQFNIDQRIKEFGSHFVVIKNLPEFLTLVKNSMAKLKLKYKHGFIKYFDEETYTGNITSFSKPLEFEFQKEFRFFVENDKDLPLVIMLGSLKEIAEIFETNAIDEFKLLKMGNLA